MKMEMKLILILKLRKLLYQIKNNTLLQQLYATNTLFSTTTSITTTN